MFLIHTDPAHAETLARALVATCRGDGWHTPVQPRLLHTLFNDLLGKDFDFDAIEPIEPGVVKQTLTSPEERSELIQLMCVIEVLCNPVPPTIEERVAEWAAELEVEDRSLVYLRDLVRGEVAKAVEDFYRLNWIGDLDQRDDQFDALLAHANVNALALTMEENPQETKRWTALGSCPEGSIGKHLFDFYQARGFKLPGQAGGANVAVAQHDWVHVLSDYGTTPLGEVEVISFQATTSRTPGAFLGLVGVLALFESGAMEKSLITTSRPHESLSMPGGIERMSEAISRGKECNADLLDVDFFELADEPLEAVRTRFNVPPKSARVLELDPYGAARMP